MPPVANAAPFLPGAIDSVLAQTYTDFEVVVSDDASEDETPSICREYDDPRFRATRSDRPLGQSVNWNRCLNLATGEYVILLHADDGLLPGYLERAVGVLDVHEDVALVHCAVQHVDELDHQLVTQRLFEADTVDRGDETLRRLLFDGCVICPAGVLVRREAYETVGRFTDKIVWGVDWHMWTRIAMWHAVAYLSEPLAIYRDHTQSGTAAVMASGRNARDERWAIDDLFALIQATRPELNGLKPAAVRGVAHRTWCFAEAMCARARWPRRARESRMQSGSGPGCSPSPGRGPFGPPRLPAIATSRLRRSASNGSQTPLDGACKQVADQPTLLSSISAARSSAWRMQSSMSM